MRNCYTATELVAVSLYIRENGCSSRCSSATTATEQVAAFFVAVVAVVAVLTTSATAVFGLLLQLVDRSGSGSTGVRNPKCFSFSGCVTATRPIRLGLRFELGSAVSAAATSHQNQRFKPVNSFASGSTESSVLLLEWHRRF